MKYKNFPLKVLSIIRRKFYSNLMIKNIDCLFDPELYKEGDEQSQRTVALLTEVYNWPEFGLKKLEDSLGFIAYIYR